MSSAQKLFIATSWLFIVLAGLLFLVPTSFSSAEGAAWTCLVVGVVSHIAMLGAIVFDVVRPVNVPAIED